MVRVLSSGEIVADDDPRATSSGMRRNVSGLRDIPAGTSPSSAQTTSGGGADAVSNLWTSANDRLHQYGMGNLEVGGYTFEPLHLVLAVLALVMFGPMAMILVVIIAVVTQSSFGGGGQNSASSSRQSNTNVPSPSTAPSFKKTSITAKNAASASTSGFNSSGPFKGSGQRLGN